MAKGTMKKQMRLLPNYSLWIVLTLFIFGSCAKQSVTPQLANEIDILEQRVVALEQQKLKTLADLRQEVADFKQRSEAELQNFRSSQQFFIDELNRIKEDLTIITNDNEINQRNIRRLTTRLKDTNKRLGDQVIALQELQRFFKSGIDIPTSAVTPKETVEFETAFNLYKKRSFKRAEQEFRKYRQSHPNSELVDDSLYFIAYMKFLQGDYSASSLRFFELLKQYPKSNRGNDAKWWLGVSLERSGDLNGALDIYKELLKLKPKDPLHIKAQFRLEELEPSSE
jgi:TolA-binding protein